MMTSRKTIRWANAPALLGRLLPPELRDRCRKFRQSKRSYYSLIVLLALYGLTLPAELICNDRPLVLVVDGRWTFPVFFDYTFSDYGGEHDAPVVSYDSQRFTDLLEGRSTQINTAALYRDPGARGPVIVETTQGAPKSVWRINAPIPHSYRSTALDSELPRQALVGPFGGDEQTPSGVSEHHWLGTDAYGKDVLARLIYGFRLSLTFGVALAVASTIIGCILGALQGYFGGLVDLAGQRATEIWGAIPELMLMMLLSDFLTRTGDLSDTQHILVLFAVLNLSAWMGMAAYMRAMFLKGRNLEYVRAARALGAGNTRIIFRHILPNSLTPIITFFPFAVSGGVMALVGLDFLGFGLKYPTPSLGEMLAQGQQHLEAWWVIVPTFVTLCVLLILLTFVGEGVRNAFDPRYK